MGEFMTTGLTNIATLVGQTWNLITGNDFLLTVACGGLLAVGIRVFRGLKRSVTR